MKNSIVAGLAVGLMLGLTGIAHATSVNTVVNFDGQTQLNIGPGYEFWRPISIDLAPGTYNFTPVQTPYPGATFGGAYSFYSWGRWSSGYAIAINDKNHVTYYGGSNDDTIAEAFAKAVGGSFSITQPSTVYFGVGDSYYGDNSGGISLHLTGGTPTPEPATMLLLGSGLAGLLGARRKKKAQA